MRPEGHRVLDALRLSETSTTRKITPGLPFERGFWSQYPSVPDDLFLRDVPCCGVRYRNIEYSLRFKGGHSRFFSLLSSSISQNTILVVAQSH